MLTFIAVFNASQDAMSLPLVFLQVLLSVLKGFSDGLWILSDNKLQQNCLVIL